MNGRDEAADERLNEAAEAVRAYLVSVRGGAPLLSGADARVLHDWLVRGVRIGAIVRGIDLVAEKRLAKRVRAPLSLLSCRAEVEKQQKHAGSWVRRVRRAPVGEPFLPAADPRFLEVSRLAAGAEREIAAVEEPDPERRAVAACAIAARFVEEAWALAPREALLAEAEARLADARSLYDDAEWDEAREIFARDGLRQRYPRLTATWIWEEANLGVE
ncbi:hypothetical protein LBMAG42_41650 [Deltaproteobacteria bacterium]|nr:hypothetical protein LBMAG42_41650 [Deltaproteobacteria bacterium]